MKRRRIFFFAAGMAVLVTIAIVLLVLRHTESGYVASSRYAPSVRGSPTFLDLGRSYPDQSFTIVIWGQDRRKFPRPPDQFYLRKTISVKGPIRHYRGKPEIIVHDPSQITLVD